MPRKKPAAALPAAEKKSRSRVAPRPRALAALKTIALAVKGSPGCEVCVADLKLALEALPEDWQPARPPSGPLQVGEVVDPPLSAMDTPEHRGLRPPYRITEIYTKGRARLCAITDAGGARAVGIVVSQLRRFREEREEQP